MALWPMLLGGCRLEDAPLLGGELVVRQHPGLAQAGEALELGQPLVVRRRRDRRSRRDPALAALRMRSASARAVASGDHIVTRSGNSRIT